MSKLTDAQKKEVKRYVNKWRPKLFLQEWFIDVNYSTDDSGTHAATVNVDTTYLRATITIYPGYWKNRKKDREEYIAHELCHCITEPLYKASWDLHCGKHVTTDHLNEMREQLTQRITNIAFDWS